MSLIVCRSIAYTGVIRPAWIYARALAGMFVAFARRKAGARRTMLTVLAFTAPISAISSVESAIPQ